MKLEKTLRHATLSAFVAFFVFSLFISIMLLAFHHSGKAGRYARQIQNSVLGFNSLVADRTRNPEDPRPFLEWKAAYDRLDALIVQSLSKSTDVEDKEILLTIQNNLRQMSLLFSGSPNKNPSRNPPEPPSPATLEKMKLQAIRILNLTTQMIKAREDTADALIRISFPIILIFILGFMIFTTIAFFWSRSRLLQPLKALQVGSERIWEGDLSHRLNLPQDDEIGYLSRTLDKMTEHLLELQKKIASEAREKLEAQHELLDIQEMERKRIGQDLHDSVAQRLAGISFMAQVLGKKLAQKNAPEAKDLQALAEEIKKALEETRQLAHGFHPVDLEHSGLVPALQNFAKTIESAFRVTCHFVCADAFSLDNPDTEAHLYRIAQEAVHNAIRHGKAKEIRITFGKHLSEAVLEIADNGKGLSPWNSEVEKGIGFKSMRYRTALIHGHLSVQSPRDQGTRVTVRCPLKLTHPHPDINTAYHLDFNPNKDRFF